MLLVENPTCMTRIGVRNDLQKGSTHMSSATIGRFNVCSTT